MMIHFLLPLNKNLTVSDQN